MPASFAAQSSAVLPTVRPSPASIGLNIGDRAPEFELPGLDGTSHRLSDYRGHPVWINFWASWCPPCRTEMPRIEGLYREHEQDGLVVLGVAVHDSDPAIRAFVAEVGATYPILLDPDGRVAAAYGAVALPVSFWLDRDGIIRDWIIGEAPPDIMTSALDKILSR
jgi:peroxiredoxin